MKLTFCYKMMASLFVVSAIFTACSKDKPAPIKPVDPPKPTQEQLIADSIYLFSKEIYYWQDIIGTSTYAMFNPRQYVVKDDALKTAENVIGAIRNYNVEDKKHGFSYAEDYQSGEADANASSPKAATYYENDYGISIKAGWKSRVIKPTSSADFAGWFVSFCYPSSGAGQAGVVRGMKLSKIGDLTLGYNEASVNKLNDMFAYQTIKTSPVEFIKANGDTLKTVLSVGKYIPNSFFKYDTIMSAGGRKVGYFMYRFFDDKENSQAPMNTVFNYFKSKNIQDIIIDLRCNNGGFTSAQNMLANYLAPSSVSGQVMYQTHFNSNLQNGNYTVLKTRFPDYRTFALNYNSTYFNTGASLDIPKVYIIVSKRSASASELLINNLKSAGVLGANLITIGDANTYGKPVGFFSISLFKKVTFWTVSMFAKNQNLESVPYDGLVPDYFVYDGVDKDFGDSTEDCVKAALTLIDGGVVSKSVNKGTVIRAASNGLSERIKDAPSRYDNMIFSR
ncbi:MAG: hypothetical protein E6Q95_04580 [Chitinophagaceae bacterium]|nr:MAG: hypothetical protein E6Q95_04580 [Chitinophagaceae bacterium]